ncbi:ABC transporter ATP-binding protein [Lysinibacillus sp. 2017]|uniref:ABC transporter ATP-binding protein n=1 Tax=unclassified Lysinibacillus TaxID=2636778 RepID=UPI000D525BD0|nr:MULTISPECIES: ABC transporter ATP-binding protein [unclassified Lysinibacillus]AWE09146.1 ABC transporter ATP-binding protein [Lysinibacillus sp. 2017]TGN35971.1 ABC transporter ATP-binding protein [Lysinibacillus sp. S2017]
MIIEVNGLIKKYKKQLVLSGINIQIDTPQIIALVGPNGSGKTTMMNCLMNLLPFQEGQVTILGKKHTDASLFYEVSYLQDNRILYGDLTGYDHLKFICHIQRIPLSRVKEIAVYVGMDSYLKKRVRSYSLGMKQHLLLAMAIINRPKLLLLDEPVNGLDPTSAIHMRNILLDLHAKGTTIIISSHNLDEIDKLTNTIYFMKDGQLLKESLENYSTSHYKLTVSNIEKAKEILSDQTFDYTVEDQSILFEETKVVLQAIIDALNQNEIQINKIENYKIGAERRYMELFESELWR